MAELDIEVAVVDVRRHHALGQAVATRTGVRHESPQVILLMRGAAVWSANHGNVTARAVSEALSQHG